MDGRRGVEGQEHVYAYAKADSYLSNLYAINDVIAEAIAEIGTFKKRPGQIALKIAKTIKDKALRCGDGVLEQRTKSIFVEKLPLSVCDNSPMLGYRTGTAPSSASAVRGHTYAIG